jgi:hypothetical protein
MLLQTQVGPSTSSDGTYPNARSGKLGDVIVSELNGRYYENVYRGNTFVAATQAGVAVTNLATTATGFILSNPSGSGKNLILLEIAIAQTSTAAAAANAAIVLAANVNPIATAVVHTTPLTVQPALLGGTATSVAKADSAATLPAAPVVVRTIWQPSVSATATTSIPPYVKDEVAGALAIAPGCAVSLSAFSAVSAIAHFTWVELPV